MPTAQMGRPNRSAYRVSPVQMYDILTQNACNREFPELFLGLQPPVNTTDLVFPPKENKILKKKKKPKEKKNTTDPVK